MSICLTGFLPFLIESIMQISVYISPWMIAWPALTPKCRRGGDSKVQWCQSLLITEVPHCMSENEYKLSHFSKSHYGAYFPVNYSSQVPFLQRENWWNLLTYRPIPKSTPRSLCDHSVMHFLLLIGLNYSPPHDSSWPTSAVFDKRSPSLGVWFWLGYVTYCPLQAILGEHFE